VADCPPQDLFALRAQRLTRNMEDAKPKPRSNSRKRNARISVRLSNDEAEVVRANAAACGLELATYLRRLGVNQRINSTLDQQAVLKLLTVNADLGRLGGLLKLWLSKDPNYYTESIELVGQDNVRQVLKRVEETQQAIQNIVTNL
jgi:predicted DNA binding CopG/RHH family protein